MQSTPDRPRPGLLERFGIAGAVSGIAVVLVLGVLLVADGRLESANRASLQSARVLELAGMASTSTADAETSTRAYLLTGRPQFAREAHGSFAQARATLTELARAVARDPAQARRVAAIRRATAQLASHWLLPSLAEHFTAPRPYAAFVAGERGRVDLERRFGGVIANEQANQLERLDDVRTLHRRVWYTGLAAILAIPFLLLLFRVYVMVALVRPVRALAELARRVEHGDDDARGDVRGLREIAQLQDAFNRMASTLSYRRREILDNAPITIWEVVGREIRWISPYWSTMAGEGAPVPSTVDEFDALVHEEDREHVVRLRREGMASLQPFDYHYRIVRSDGQIRWLWTRARPAGTVDGQARAIGFTLDVTEDERTRQELAHAQRLESVGHLATGVAHDFNNLLTVIAGYATIAQMRRGEPGRLDEPLKEIMDAAQRASALTRQLLMFSSQQPFELQLLDLNQVVRAVMPMLGRLIEERITVVCRLGEDVPPVRFDRGQLEQVLVNLAVNARDAIHHNGRIVIETGAVGEGEQRSVRVSVADDGDGIDASTMERIFDPFFTTKAPGQGTGLGLSTVHGIVARGGGHIEVDSRPQEGTTFVVYLPAVVEVAAAA